MAERFNAAVLKTVEDASPPRVRISASPPIVVQKALLKARLFCCKHVENTNAELAELWERSSTPSERQTAVCRLPEAMSAGAAQRSAANLCLSANCCSKLSERRLFRKDCRNTSGNDSKRSRLSVWYSVFNAITFNVILRRERSELSGESRNIISIFFKRIYHPGYSANSLRSKPSVTCVVRSMIEMLGVLAIIAALSIVVQKVTRRKSLRVTFYQPIFCVFSFSYSRLK